MLRSQTLLVSSLIIMLCTACNVSKQKPQITESDVPLAWVALTLDIAKNTPANSPTFASRSFGYSGLTMYETVVHSDPKHVSLSGQLNGLEPLPLPKKNIKYNWILCLNAGQAEILRSIYIQTSVEEKAKIDSLEKLIYHSIADTITDKNVAVRSVAYGKEIARKIFDWSMTDGGHRGYLANFDGKMEYPNKPGSWKAPYYAQQITRLPLHPHWGDNRTFIKADSNWKMPYFVPYDTTKPSKCFELFNEVYQANTKITEEQKEIALWWNDDPSETYTPPGHSYNLAAILVKQKKPDLVTAAETFARTGIAVADAFIICWRMKYYFYSERPSTYVSEHINADWEPFWPDPPFPAFPGGHATQAGASATALAGLYTDNLTFTDSSHVGRPRDKFRNVEYKARHFTSLWQAAQETAYSRFLGGIHTRQDNEIGLQEGKKVGEHINALRWTN